MAIPGPPKCPKIGVPFSGDPLIKGILFSILFGVKRGTSIVGNAQIAFLTKQVSTS